MKKFEKYYKPLLLLILFGAGLTHFIAPEQFAPVVPDPFTDKYLWVYITGVIEIILGFGLLIKKFTRLFSYITAFYFISLLPAHFEIIIIEHEIFGIYNKAFFIFRVFLQLIPIYIAWKIPFDIKNTKSDFIRKTEQNLRKRWSGPKAWHSKWLWAAAWYNLGFGFWVIIFPEQVFNLFSMNQPYYLFLWQSIGMIVGVYGIGYAIAAIDEMKHWPIVLVGMLGKFFGPIGFFMTYYSGQLEFSFITLFIFNDLIWYPAFISILYRKLKLYFNN